MSTQLPALGGSQPQSPFTAGARPCARGVRTPSIDSWFGEAGKEVGPRVELVDAPTGGIRGVALELGRGARSSPGTEEGMRKRAPGAGNRRYETKVQ